MSLAKKLLLTLVVFNLYVSRLILCITMYLSIFWRYAKPVLVSFSYGLLRFLKDWIIGPIIVLIEEEAIYHEKKIKLDLSRLKNKTDITFLWSTKIPSKLIIGYCPQKNLLILDWSYHIELPREIIKPVVKKINRNSSIIYETNKSKIFFDLAKIIRRIKTTLQTDSDNEEENLLRSINCVITSIKSYNLLGVPNINAAHAAAHANLLYDFVLSYKDEIANFILRYKKGTKDGNKTNVRNGHKKGVSTSS